MPLESCLLFCFLKRCCKQFQAFPFFHALMLCFFINLHHTPTNLCEKMCEAGSQQAHVTIEVYNLHLFIFSDVVVLSYKCYVTLWSHYYNTDWLKATQKTHKVSSP